MQLYALLVTDGQLGRWSRGDALRTVEESDVPGVELSASGQASLLQTVAIQLEADRRGSRFPLLWIATALVEDVVIGWRSVELAGLVGEIDVVERELAALPISRAANVWLGDEGYPEVYIREVGAVALERCGSEAGERDLASWFEQELAAVREVCEGASAAGSAIVLLRPDDQGVQFLWGAPTR
jgi:hypothetical protein